MRDRRTIRCPKAFSLVWGLLALVLCVLEISIAGAKEYPNIVLIVADDLGYGELGCQGNPQIPTPHIDSIAKNGVRFTQGYVTASYCSQSRAGLLTGRHQLRFGYTINPIGAQNDDPNVGLPLTETTLPEYLKDNGYVTGLFGKWHLGGTSKYHPLRRGFDDFFGFLHEGHYYAPPPYLDLVSWIRRKTLPKGGQGVYYSGDLRLIYSTHMGQNEPNYDANNPILRGGQPIEEKEYLTDALTREATSFLRRNFDRPFFMVLSYNAVHSPMQATDQYFHKFRNIKDIQRRIFAAMLAKMDDSVGDVLATLQQIRATDNTIIIFMSDNGGPTRELTSSNRPLRGEKGSLYEGGVRVPFMMQWRSKIPRNSVFRQPVSSLDLFATVQDVVGFKLRSGKAIDGINLMPYVAGSKTGRPHERLFWQSSKQSALRSGDWKIVKNRQNASTELFNLATDIGESKNLAESNEEMLRKLNEELASAEHEYSAAKKPAD